LSVKTHRPPHQGRGLDQGLAPPLSRAASTSALRFGIVDAARESGTPRQRCVADMMVMHGALITMSLRNAIQSKNA